ncbi:MAG TPA: anti-sigma factor, partial [Thermoanaerobaculia bacterium]|nr:anti-sigma factor [Thermoanaerobaculia bacterium]
ATAATIFLALWGWREFSIRVMRENATSTRAEIAQLRTKIDQLSAQNEKLSSVLASDTQTIALTGQEIAPAASAKVFLVPNRRRALVFFNNLPANPGDKSYQLWIIRADRPNPQSAGVFDVDATGQASISIDNLPLSTEIKALAVTLEPKGGVEQPTNTAFYDAGNT